MKKSPESISPTKGLEPRELYGIHLSFALGEMLALSTQSDILFLQFGNKNTLQYDLDRLHSYFPYSIKWQSNSILNQLEKELKEYFLKTRKQFTIPIELIGTNFQVSVWNSLLEIPYGVTRSYAQQSTQMGNPKAIRAVAAANGKNRIAILVPCHRIIGSNGKLTGYRGGVERKKWLLDFEQGILFS